MEYTTFPLLNEITLDSIATHCKQDFGINKGNFQKKIFNAGSWLSRIRRGMAKMDDSHFQNMFELIKSQSDSFVTTMKTWYPSLSKYTTEAEIKEIIKANLNGTASKTSICTASSINSKRFLEVCLQYESPIKCIKIVAQTGWQWFYDPEKTDLLTWLAQKDIEIQVIQNSTSPTIKKISQATKDPEKELRYMGFDRTLTKWHDYEKTYSTIKFRISDYPILRKILIVEFKDNSAKALIRDYTYGSPVAYSSPHKQLSCDELDYKYYQAEFEFLWNHSQTYEQWHNALPKLEEAMQPSDYVLMYPSHVKTIEPNSKWIYSVLSITDKNTVSLKVNITESLDSIGEYTYQGKLKLTRNNIFIALYDEDQQEKINISLVRPLSTKDRFIGIMTALSPSGQQPVAFKCACIGQSLLKRINFQILSQMLSHNNKEWDNNLLTLENQDINTFYSDYIFIDRG